jgi:hypothetical protein
MTCGACRTQGREEQYIHNFSLKTEGKYHLDGIGVAGMIILK